MLLLADGRLDHGGVEGVWDEGDDEVVLGDGIVQGLLVGDVEGDWGRIFDTLGELLCAFKSTAGWGTVSDTEGRLVGGKEFIPTETLTPASLRTSRVGRVTKPAPSMRTFLFSTVSLALDIAYIPELTYRKETF